MNAARQKTLRARWISFLLAIIMIVACVPSAMFQASARGGMREPIVLTNASVEFRDSSFREISTVDSGAMFYLMISIAGNNVNQGGGGDQSDKYRVYITDENLLLPNFAGNGFVDGASYNGYTLHYDAQTGQRYIEFDIRNGSTQVIRLQARFANGITPDGDSATVQLVQTSTNKKVENTIMADADLNWSASKSENRNQITAQELASGTSVNYTLNATPSNPTKSTGAWWVEELTFSDTITLNGMTFANGAQTTIEAAVKAAIQNAGYSEPGELHVSVSGTKADISFTLQSKNTSKEMDAVSLNVSMPLNSDTVTLGSTDGTITNHLSVGAKPYGTNSTVNIGGNSVDLNVKAPVGAQFSLSKTVDDQKPYYITGDTVTFTISATNYGDAAGDITLTDSVPSGLTLTKIQSENSNASVSGNSITFNNVAPNTTVSATVTCQVTQETSGTLTNMVTDN